MMINHWSTVGFGGLLLVLSGLKLKKITGKNLDLIISTGYMRIKSECIMVADWAIPSQDFKLLVGSPISSWKQIQPSAKQMWWISPYLFIWGTFWFLEKIRLAPTLHIGTTTSRHWPKHMKEFHFGIIHSIWKGVSAAFRRCSGILTLNSHFQHTRTSLTRASVQGVRRVYIVYMVLMLVQACLTVSSWLF